METTQTTVNILQMLGSATCQDIDDFIKELNASEYESKNMSRDEYIDFLRSPHCQPKPYPIIDGWQKWCASIIIILFLLFGLIGNSLSATIMFRRSRRGLSSYFYLALLAMIDIGILYTGGLLLFLEIALNIHPQLHSNFLCRSAFYIQHFFTYISAWLIVAVTLERFMVVRFPFRSIRLCRLHVTYTITLLIFLFFSLYTAHCFFTMKIFSIEIQTDLGYHPNHTVCDLVIYPRLLAFVDLLFYSVLPSILILICNILIVITMFHAIKKRQSYLQANSYTPTTDKQKSASTNRTQFLRSRSAESSPIARSISQVNKQRLNQSLINQSRSSDQKVSTDSTSSTGIRLTCLLLTISFIFVLCTLPISIRSLIADYLPSQKSTIHWQLTQLCLTLLMYFNHTINFVLYCLTGRAFRSECRKVLLNLCFFKGIHISCTANRHANKHQQFVLIDQTRFIHPQQRRQQQQQRFQSNMKVVHL